VLEFLGVEAFGAIEKRFDDPVMQIEGLVSAVARTRAFLALRLWPKAVFISLLDGLAELDRGLTKASQLGEADENRCAPDS
jgi:hypothetical protein